MSYYKAFKFRIYPNKDQQAFLSKAFGHNRWVYNWALELILKAKKDNTPEPKGGWANWAKKEFIVFKNSNQSGYEWLKKDSMSRVHEYVFVALKDAFDRQRTGQNGEPCLKKKHHRQSCTTDTNASCKVDFDKSTVDFQGICKGIKAIIHRKFFGRMTKFTFSKSSTGKYYVSICVELQGELPTPVDFNKDSSVGIDLGLKTLAVSSDGYELNNPKWFQKSEKRIATLRSKQSKCIKYSNNYKKLGKKIAKLEEKNRFRRSYYIHQYVNDVYDRYDSVFLEDLNVQGMMRNPRLAKAIGDAGWGMFSQIFAYKAKYQGKNCEHIDRFYPSSKTCNNCKHKLDDLKLETRLWECPKCKAINDRDYNASKNILDEGINMVNREGFEELRGKTRRQKKLVLKKKAKEAELASSKV